MLSFETNCMPLFTDARLHQTFLSAHCICQAFYKFLFLFQYLMLKYDDVQI